MLIKTQKKKKREEAIRIASGEESLEGGAQHGASNTFSSSMNATRTNAFDTPIIKNGNKYANIETSRKK